MYFKGEILNYNLKLVLTVLSKDHNLGKYLYLARNPDYNNPNSINHHYGEYIFDLLFIPE